MPWFPVDEVGKIGVIRDLADHDLPPEAWTSISNARFRNGAVEKVGGSTTPWGTPIVAPYFGMAVPTETEVYWLYAGLNDVYAMLGSTHTRISKSAGVYTATADVPWNGFVFSGIPIINNANDYPQMWNGVDFYTPSLLADLSNWPASTYAKTLRAFKQYLVALNITKSGVQYPHMVKWSHPADPGTVPGSWDETDATKDAGEIDLAETDGYLLDCLPLGDVNIVYKEDSIWGMQHVGGNSIFRFYGISKLSGLMASRCVAQFPGGHALFTPDDLVITDGREVRSIADARIQRYIFNNMNTSRTSRCFVAMSPYEREIWFCYPLAGADWCNYAHCWNYEDNTWGERILPELSFAKSGIFEPDAAAGTWDGDSETWDADADTWNKRTYGTITPELIGFSGENTKVYQFDSGQQEEGSDMTFTIERTGLAMTGRDREGKIKVDFNKYKFIRGVRPKIECSTSINIYVGAQTLKDGTVTWYGPFAFNPSTDTQIFCQVPGRLMAVRFSGTIGVSFKLRGFDVDLTVDGDY